MQLINSAPSHTNPQQVLLHLDLDSQPLLARISRYAHDHLALQPGDRVYAQFMAEGLG